MTDEALEPVDVEGLLLTRDELSEIAAALHRMIARFGDVAAGVYRAAYLSAIRATPPDGETWARTWAMQVAGEELFRVAVPLGLDEERPWRS